jgi:hypothetical protein
MEPWTKQELTASFRRWRHCVPTSLPVGLPIYSERSTSSPGCRAGTLWVRVLAPTRLSFAALSPLIPGATTMTPALPSPPTLDASESTMLRLLAFPVSEIVRTSRASTSSFDARALRKNARGTRPSSALVRRACRGYNRASGNTGAGRRQRVGIVLYIQLEHHPIRKPQPRTQIPTSNMTWRRGGTDRRV